VPNRVTPQSEIVEDDHGNAPGLTVRGEIDIATSPQLKLALDKAIRDSTGAFVLDLRDDPRGRRHRARTIGRHIHRRHATSP
jgi:membrane-bound ClpP family serine protease